MESEFLELLAVTSLGHTASHRVALMSPEHIPRHLQETVT